MPLSIRDGVIEFGKNYWASKSKEDRLPARSDIDPLDIPTLLPQIVLLEVRNDPWDFRFRLIGTNVVHHRFTDWTGIWMYEIEHMAFPSRIFNACVDVATSEKPLRSDTPYVGPRQNCIRAEVIILPLG
ncbi:MAG: PAS domain-containing protein [Alphaproteobacteria bacterium]